MQDSLWEFLRQIFYKQIRERPQSHPLTILRLFLHTFRLRFLRPALSDGTRGTVDAGVEFLHKLGVGSFAVNLDEGIDALYDFLVGEITISQSLKFIFEKAIKYLR